MNIHHQAPNEVVVTEQAPAAQTNVEDPFQVRGPTRVIYRWRILEKIYDNPNGEQDRTEAQRLGALELEKNIKTKAEWEELNTLYYVAPSEWEASETQWRLWVSKRDPENGGLDPGRFHVSAKKVSWEQELPYKIGAEERLSKVFEAQHRSCITCQAVRIMREDSTASEEERERRIARLAHTIPRLQLFSSTGGPASPRVLGGSKLNDLMDIPTWDHAQAKPTQKKSALSTVKLPRKVLPKADILDGSRTEFIDRKAEFKYLNATKDLLKNTDDSTMLDAVMQDPTLLRRAQVFRQNKQAVENAMSAAHSLQCSSAIQKMDFAKTAAEAWELERDLVRLEKMQEGLRDRITWAKKGYSVDWYTKKRAIDRKENWPDRESHPIRWGRLGFHKGVTSDDEKEEDAKKEEGKKEEEKIVAIENPIGRIERIIRERKASQLQRQKSPDVPAQPEAAELNAEPESSPSPLDLTESPELTPEEQPTQANAGASLFLNTLHNFNKHRRQAALQDNRSSSTEGDPFKYDAVRKALSPTNGAATPGNEVSVGNASKGKAKKRLQGEETKRTTEAFG